MDKDILNIDEVAEMLSLHSRTIRRYIKDGTLKGTKIGGEWRIRRSDLKTMLGDTEVMHELQDKWNSDVSSFLSGKQETPETGYRICTIVDCRFQGSDEAQEVSSALLRIVNEYKPESGKTHFQYTYDAENGKARFILWGSPDYTIRMLSVLPSAAKVEE